MYILLAAGLVFAVCYGGAQIHKYRIVRYFNMFYVATIVQLITVLFWILLEVSGFFPNNYAPVQSLGQACVFLFFAIANIAYIPVEHQEVENRHFSIVSFIIALIVAAICLFVLISNFDIQNIVLGSIYCISIAICTYFCINTLIDRYNNPFCKAIKPANICVLIIIICSVFDTCSYLLTKLPILDILLWAEYIIMTVCFVAILPLTAKGLKPWQFSKPLGKFKKSKKK